MTAFVIDSGIVRRGECARVEAGIAGETISAGQAVLRGTGGKYLLSDADGDDLTRVTGIALNGASDGQPLSVQTSGEVTIGATLSPGAAYYLSPTPGGICPLDDLGEGDDVILIGMAKSTSVMMLAITDPDVTI